MGEENSWLWSNDSFKLQDGKQPNGEIADKKTGSILKKAKL